MKNRYSKQEIEILSNNKHVKHVRENRLTFTFEFNTILWEAWKREPSIAILKKELVKHGFDLSMINTTFISHKHHRFLKLGKPSGGKNKVFGEKQSTFKATSEGNEILISTGLFIKKCNGIAFHPDFINELYYNYPTYSIEDQLEAKGLDLEFVGHTRINQLKRKFDNNKVSSSSETCDDDFIEYANNHPYIKSCTSKQIRFKNNFFIEASYLSDLHIDEILSVFEIDYNQISYSIKNNLKYKIKTFKHTHREDIEDINLPLLLKIKSNYNAKLIEEVEANFKAINHELPSMSKQQKKQLCKWIKMLPKTSKGEYCVRSILKKVGISKTSYYTILKDANYGTYEAKKDAQDQRDIETIKQVIEYNEYPKGSRMIYMMMKKITGEQFGREKILRLMRKADIKCEIRKANPSRRSAKKMMEKNTKPNHLKRKFKLYKPKEALLSDVSYLKCQGKTYYLSAIKDASSGKAISMVVSESNDLQLAIDTIKSLRATDYKDNAFFHTDQGTLYLNEYFQKEVEELGFIQSMSRRGNCWDNSPQESFFGHFKDECNYENCKDIHELRVKLKDYQKNYNYERPQWERNKMTPVEFEEYLLTMSDEEYEVYYQKELDKYNKMMEKAKENAKQRAKDIGAYDILSS